METLKDKRLEQIYKAVELVYKELDKVKELTQRLDSDLKVETYKSMPGVEGVFDGVYLVSDTGEKYEIPANYAAKSRVVYGDRLKMIEEDGKKLFKQIEKSPRRKVEGVASKKEGLWYVLTDVGSYRISDIAAEFNKVEINDKVIVIIPENHLSSPFAALDKVLTKKEPNVVPMNAAKVTQQVKTGQVPIQVPQVQVIEPVVSIPVTTKVDESKGAQLDKSREFVMDIKPQERRKPAVPAPKPSMPKPMAKPATAPIASVPSAPQPQQPRPNSRFTLEDDDLR